MAKEQPWNNENLTKAEWIARKVAKAVNAGKAWDVETVDFSDPNRPLTCLEVDFPIIPINQIAAIEGNAGKPIYQMSKWWARRRSSVFRSMLLAAAMKAPDEPSEAAKLVWEVYYGNHQKNGGFKQLKVADIFMGGGTTVVEGTRLGMQMYGNDINPVAWMVVKNELTRVRKEDVEVLLADIEAEVKPAVIPFYACECPRGHKGRWTQISTSLAMGQDFDPLALTSVERKDYRYDGPEVIYTFWAKHGPCQITNCGHRTPIISSPVMAVKSFVIQAWARNCKHCGKTYDVEERGARMAPGRGVEFIVAKTEQPFAVAMLNGLGNPASAVCPHCGKEERFGKLVKPANKTVELSLLVHPDWLKGESSKDTEDRLYGGTSEDSIESTIRWNKARASNCRLIEVRGTLPDQITLADGTAFLTGKDGGTVPGKSTFSCASCGSANNIREAVAATKKNGPTAMYAIQGYCPTCKEAGEVYKGRFFASVSDTRSYDFALKEWEARKNGDLSGFWPTSKIPIGAEIGPHDVNDHGYSHWWKMFNPRQLIIHASMLKAISSKLASQPDNALFILGVFQQYLQCMTMFNHYEVGWDKMAVMFANNSFRPKSTAIENNFSAPAGRGNWESCTTNAIAGLDWTNDPWELVHNGRLVALSPELKLAVTGLSEKTFCGDPLNHNQLMARHSSFEQVTCGSSTELQTIADESCDAVITDPPFGGILQYAELADFFYVWLRLALKDRYPDYFSAEYTPKTMEAVANSFRHPGTDKGTGRKQADVFYQRLLTECWREAKRIIKPGGLLAFTFHHSEDHAWVSVLESLFDAGFTLAATYPIRGDETKGDNAQFGSQRIEFDIIHVCRKRHEEPQPISWAKLRRQVLQDVRDIQNLLEHHSQEGLPEADLQVIRRGKALEYFSRHYGKVYKDVDTPMSLLEALLGINQLLDEEAGGTKEPPPHNAEPFTRMLLRLFDGKAELQRDQIQKFLRGTGSAPSDLEIRGWVVEKRKVFHLVSPVEIAHLWVGKQRKGMTTDYDQAMYFIGACFENSGINATETLNNPNFRPHPALGAILTWFKTHGADSPVRNAATIASQLYKAWEAKNQPKAKELTLFDQLGEEPD
jgi:putative DNA methylase